VTDTTALLPLSMHPLTLNRWPDLEALFGERGACGGCWCMTWRLPRSQFEQQKGAVNKHAFRALVAAGDVPGVLAYRDGLPIGWCAIAPRDEYPALGRSRILRPVDDAPVWSISCLFVARPFRRRGLSVRLIAAATDYARERGARVVEGYPIEPRGDAATMPDAFVWTGLAAAFRAAGFAEVARRSDTRPIMRRIV
jgi:GNAT superfamily N-acetyltransferase